MFYALNSERNREGYGGNSTPMTANYPFGAIDQPPGENYSVDSYYHPSTNEVYSWVFNSLGVHYIQRLSDENGLQVVYQNWGDNCLQLSAEPRHVIKAGRATIRLETVYDKRDGIGCKNRHGKYLVWTDGLNAIGHIDVEASIATDSFRTPFFETCPDYCSLIRLCVPDPCTILTGKLVPRALINDGLSNKILDIGFQFIYRYITYDERRSEWSTPSTLYFQSKDNCFESPDSLPRCYKLRLPIGNPQVERIEVAFFKGDKSTEGNNNVYLSYEIIDKYKKYDSSQQYWYERQLSEVITGNGYSDEDCSFDYYFCNDKNCNPIDTPRTYNPMPISPQGLLVLKDRLGFYNFIQGNCPIDKFEIDKFNIVLDCANNNDCVKEFAEVRVRLVIVEIRENTNQFVFRLNGSMGGPDDIADPAYYGGVPVADNSFVTEPVKTGWGQEFDKARNFIAHIEGSDYYSEMIQARATNGFTNAREYGIVSGMSSTDDSVRNKPIAVMGQGYFYQEAAFKVPKGTAGFIQILSPSSGSNPNTSANVAGTIPIQALVSHGKYGTNWQDIYTAKKTQIYFDTCNGDQSLTESFLVHAVNGYKNVGTENSDEFLYSGYVSDANSKSVEGCEVYVAADYESTCDHNGHYFFFGLNSPVNGLFKVEQDCAAFSTIKTVSLNGILRGDSITDIQIENADYTNKFYEDVRVHVKDCNGNPIGGVRVSMSGTRYKVSDAETGIATFKLRNYSTRNRVIQAVIIDRKECINVDCNGDCGGCMPKTTLIPLLPCFQTTPSTDAFFMSGLNISDLTVQKVGLKSGGRYPFGFVVKGDCGRISAVNELPYVDIPKVQVSGLNGFCSLSYNATGINLPVWGTCLEIVRGENSNPYELQWVIDKIEKTADNKIRLTIQSLIDYNISYGAKTNTKYQWLAGDRIEFVRDENGAVLASTDHGILNYLIVSPFNDKVLSGNTTDVDFFNQLLIEDDGKLDFLKAGSIIELQRQKECTIEPVYFSIGVSIPIQNGKLVIEAGTFKTFDTYQIRRIINNGALLTFEHHSPSDFWGDHLTDIGKPYFVNHYENERRYTQSMTLNSPTIYNYFGDAVKTFDGLSSDIISMNIKDGKVIMIICETDNSLATASDDLLRVGTDGVIRAASPDAIVSDGEAKLSGEYGCAYDSIGSIFYGDGFAEWYDIRYFEKINNDYRTAKSVSFGKTNVYFRWVGKLITSTNKIAVNSLDKIRFSTGQNTQTRAVQLTVKSLRNAAVNNDDKPYISPNSTILFDNDSEDYLTWASWTPEGYSNMVLNDGFGCAMITFQNGRPYIHPVEPEKYNEFFGIACDRVNGYAVNGEGKMPQKNKVPISYEAQSDKLYFVAHVETSDPNFSSEVPVSRVKKTEKKCNASFLSNKNARGGLYNSGVSARDYFIKVTFKRDNTDQLKYGTIDNEKRTKFDVLGLIITNFTFSEESGFTNMP